VTTILLARHGETDWNREHRFQGHADTPLNELGRAQANDLAEELAGEPISSVYSSDLVRAHETARIVAARLGLGVTAVPELREIDTGEWSGLTVGEIEARFPAGLARWRAGEIGWERGETIAEVTARAAGAVSRIAASHPDSTTLVVCHGAVIRSLAAHAQGIDYRTQRRLEPVIPNCGVVRIAVEDGGWRRLD
jgi:broad specificity phosphatase PhoE